MRILYLSQYFPPEAGATQSRAYDMATTWVQLGHAVTMLTEFPNHPSGIIPKEYHGKLIEHSILDGIDVFRVWVKASPDKKFLNRMLFYLTYMINAIVTGILFIRGKFDFIYATSPPLFVGGAAIILKVVKRIPMIFEVRDLWPESAVALHELSNPRALSLATKLEELCYRKASRVVVVTQGIYDRLVERGISTEKMIIIPNGANIALFKYKAEDRKSIRKELNLEGKFVVIYAGIFGLAQGLEDILNTARLLEDHPKVHFLLIGDGPKKAELISLADKYQLPNITILPEKPRERIPAFLSASDIALIPLRKAEIFKGVLPSKIFDAWACKLPVLISIDGEAHQLVERVNGGIYVPPENPNKMSQEILKLMDLPAELDAMGKNGFSYTVQNHSRQILAEKLIHQLAQISL